MYAFDINIQEDWGDGPDVQSGYDYSSPLAALDAALDAIDATAALIPTWAGRDDDCVGIYVFGEQVGDDDNGPGWIWSPALPGVTLSALDSESEDI